jgi:hypothetical protein
MGEVNVQRRGVSRGVLFVLPAHECTQKRNGVNTSSTSYSINFFCIGVHIRMQRCYAGSKSNLCLYCTVYPSGPVVYRVPYGILEFPWSYEA